MTGVGGLSVRVLGGAEAIVEVGVLLAGVLVLGPVELPEDAELLEAVELVEAGEGDTIDGVVVLEDVVAVEGAVGDELVAAVGFGLSLGTPLANGLRAIRASSTLAGTGTVGRRRLATDRGGGRRRRCRRRHRHGGRTTCGRS